MRVIVYIIGEPLT